MQHALGVGERVVVPEAEHAIAEGLQQGSATGVVLHVRRMLAAVQLDDQLPLATAEVHDIWADGHLTRELGTEQAPIAKTRPEAAFHVGLTTTEPAGVVARGFADATRQFRTPHPALSPEGRGI
jgi:hypothetical protein